MRSIMAIATLALFGVLPANAQVTQPAGTVQSKSQCQANFRAADYNGDGWLNRGEILSARSVVPTTLGSRDIISRSDFINTCNQIAKHDTP
ncbi:MAG: hypothetical protein AB7L90_02100 [Hyphomicrobiaceae bacterium]